MQLLDIIGERFALMSHVASGGMGDVFRGHDRERDVAVAVKILHADTELDAQRFQRESMLLAQLEHPGIVGYIAHGETPDGRQYLVQEWLEGFTLARKLVTDGLTARESVTVVHRVAEALAVAHEHEIVHRDLMPDNLFLEHGACEAAKILDFGIARQQGIEFRVTSTGTMVGSVGYMAPEQVRGARDLSIRADVFALGCVLYECLTGEPAFPGQNALGVGAKILFTDPETLETHFPDAPVAMRDLVARMLAKDPAKRPANGGEVAHALASLDSLPVTPRRRRVDDSPETVIRQPDFDTVAGSFEALEDLVCLVLATIDDPDTTNALPDVTELRQAIASTITTAETQLERLPDGSLVVLVTPRDDVRSAARAAVRVARALQSRIPNTSIALAIAAQGDLVSCGLTEAIDVGTSILESAAMNAILGHNAGHSNGSGIALDLLSASLLADCFHVEETPSGWLLVAETT